MKKQLRKNLVILLCSVMMFFHPPVLAAHSHIFVESETTLFFAAKRLLGISFTWHFDDMYSSLILFDYDLNTDGTLPPVDPQRQRPRRRLPDRGGT